MTWEATQRELNRRTSSGNEKSKHSNRYWCSGIIKCGACGSHYVSRTKKLENGEIYKAWRCSETASYGKKKTTPQGELIGCDSESVNERVLTACIQHLLKHLEFNKDKIKNELIEEIKSLKVIKDNTKVKNTIEEKISEINAQKVELIRLKVKKELAYRL